MPLQYTCSASKFFIFFIKVSTVEIVKLRAYFLKKKNTTLLVSTDSPTAFPDPYLLGIIGTLRSNDADGKRQRLSFISLTVLGFAYIWHVHHAFLYISLSSLHDYNVKVPRMCLISRFVEDENTRQKLSFQYFLELSPFEFRSTPKKMPIFDEGNEME